MPKFTDLILPEPLQRAAADLQFIKPTSIQEQCIPWLLDNDQDMIAVAQTGTGKTAAFGFPTLSRTDIERLVVQTLILCPTRELCLQINSDFASYAKYMPRIKATAIYGGAPIYKQKDALKAGLHIVIGTPGRVLDMIKQGALKIDHVERLILDEADEMLNMGFKDDLFEIMSHTPSTKQILLFSATMNREVVKLASTFMKDPFRISSGNEDQGADNIEHFYYKVHARDKYLALKRIADMSPNIYGIVFCRTRTETQEIANKLQHDGYNADALHGDLSQGQRELVMNRFRSKYVQLLIATDVAARGLDVDDLTHIINYHVPLETEIYIHRSGRTGRAGKSGISLSIIHHKEISSLKAIEKRLGRDIVYSPIPGGREICEKQLFNFIDTVERIEVNTEQIESFLPSVYKKLSWMTREELIQRFVSVEFNRFLQYYKDVSDLENAGVNKVRDENRPIVLKTFRLNIGYKQELNKRDLMRFVNQLKVARSIEIGQINIHETYTLIELDGEYESQLIKAFSRNKLNGVTLEASVSTDIPQRTESTYQKRDGGSSYNKKPYAKEGSGFRSDRPRRSTGEGDKQSDRPRRESSGYKSDRPQRTPRTEGGDFKSDRPQRAPRTEGGDFKSDRPQRTPRTEGGDFKSDRPQRTPRTEGGDFKSDRPQRTPRTEGGDFKSDRPQRTPRTEGGDFKSDRPKRSPVSEPGSFRSDRPKPEGSEFRSDKRRSKPDSEGSSFRSEKPARTPRTGSGDKPRGSTIEGRNFRSDKPKNSTIEGRDFRPERSSRSTSTDASKDHTFRTVRSNNAPKKEIKPSRGVKYKSKKQ